MTALTDLVRRYPGNLSKARREWMRQRGRDGDKIWYAQWATIGRELEDALRAR